MVFSILIEGGGKFIQVIWCPTNESFKKTFFVFKPSVKLYSRPLEIKKLYFYFTNGAIGE